MSHTDQHLSDDDEIAKEKQILEQKEKSQADSSDNNNADNNSINTNQKDNTDNENININEDKNENSNTNEKSIDSANPPPKDDLKNDDSANSDKNDCENMNDAKSDTNKSNENCSDKNEDEKKENEDKESNNAKEEKTQTNVDSIGEKDNPISDEPPINDNSSHFVSEDSSKNERIEDQNENKSEQTTKDSESDTEEHPTLLQHTDAIFKAIAGVNESENEKDNPSEKENEKDNSSEKDASSENEIDKEASIENTNDKEASNQNENDKEASNQNANDKEPLIENADDKEASSENANDKEASNENTNDKEPSPENTDDKEDSNENANDKKASIENADDKEASSENAKESQIENESNTEALSQLITDSRMNSNSNDDISTSQPLSNLLSSAIEKLQTDTVEITDVCSQTDPVPISVSCQTSFPEFEIRNETNAFVKSMEAKNASEEDEFNKSMEAKNRELQMQDRENMFASFNCRCTQTRKFDKSLYRTNALQRNRTKYSRPRKTSQNLNSRAKTANIKKDNSLLKQLEISQPVSPIQNLSPNNSALSSNVGSPRSSEGSTLSSSTQNNNSKTVKNRNNVLPIISSKSLASNTTRPRTLHSGFSSSSGIEPSNSAKTDRPVTRSTHIKSSKLSMIKNGSSTTSKSCVLKKNINVPPSTMKTVLSNSHKTKPNKTNNNFKTDILNDAAHLMTKELLSEPLSEPSAASENKNQKSDLTDSTEILTDNSSKASSKKNTENKTQIKQKIDLDEQINALTVNLLPGNPSSNQISSRSKKSSNSTKQSEKDSNDINETGGTSQVTDDKFSSSSKVNKNNEEEEDEEELKIIKKRDYQGNTTEINFTDNESTDNITSQMKDDFIEEEEDESQEEHKTAESTSTAAAADDESGELDYEQMIDDLLNYNYPSADDSQNLLNYIKKSQIDSIINEDYASCDRLRTAETILVNNRMTSRFIVDYYTTIETKLSKAEADLEEIEQCYKERLERFDEEHERMIENIRSTQQEEIDNFESSWGSEKALIPFDKASSGLLDLRFKQKKLALIREFASANQVKKTADELQEIEEGDAFNNAENSMKIAYNQLIEKHNNQFNCFEEKWKMHRFFIESTRDDEIKRQKLLIQQLSSKRDDKYEARARNHALSEKDLMSTPVTPRTFESLAKYRKDTMSSKLRLNSSSIVQTLHPSKKQTKRPFTPGKTKRYGGYC